MKNVFNFKIFKEFFKQLRVIGLLMTIITCFIASLIPISTYIDLIETMDKTVYGQSIITINDIIIVFFMIFFLTVPMLSLSAFQFLNKRNTCDFYHSIPHKRTCLFFSIFAAILSWIFINLASTTIVFSALFALFKKYIIFDISQLLLSSINIFIISLLVCSSIILACTLTGNLLNNICVSGIILFLPRVFISIFTSLIVGSIPFFNAFDTISLLNNNTNLLFGSFMNFLNVSNNTYYYHLGLGTVYTLILSIIYIIIAAYVFKIRKSEAAGNSSISPVLQTIFRVCIGIFITLPSIIAIFEKLTNQSEFDSNSVLAFYVITNILIAILFMFVYELISTKNIKKAIHSLIFVPLHLVTFVALIGVVFSIYHYSLNFVPSQDSVDYIQLYDYSSDEDYSSNYFESKIADAKIYDKAIINELLDTLHKDIKLFKENRYHIYSNSDYINVTFVCGNREYSRLVYFNYPDYSDMIDKISKSIDLDSILLDLPDPDNSQIVVSGDINYITEKFAKELYKVFLENVERDPETYLSYMRTHLNSNLHGIGNSIIEDDDFTYNMYFHISTTNNGTIVDESIPIIIDYPEILKLIYSKSFDDKENRSLAKDLLSNINEYIYKYDEIYIDLYPLCKSQSELNPFSVYYSNDGTYYEYNYEGIPYTPEEIKEAKDNLTIASDYEVEILQNIANNIDNNYDENSYLYRLDIYFVNNYAAYETQRHTSISILIATPTPISDKPYVK